MYETSAEGRGEGDLEHRIMTRQRPAVNTEESCGLAGRSFEGCRVGGQCGADGSSAGS